MQTVGKEPFIEISKHGAQLFGEFNPYNAQIKSFDGRTIEELVNSAKKHDDGAIGLSVIEAHRKNGIVVNKRAVQNLAFSLWVLYFEENPHLVDTLVSHGGVSDRYAKQYSRFHIDALWKIRGLELRHRLFSMMMPKIQELTSNVEQSS